MTSAGSPTASQLIYEFQPTTPAGTSQNSPFTTNFAMPPLEVRFIQWVVPPGPQGNLGWQITCSGQVVVPQNGAYIVTDNERNTWELDEQIQTGAWGFVGYNTGSYPHTVYLRFLLDPLAAAEPPFDLGLICGVPNLELDSASGPAVALMPSFGLGLADAGA